MSTTLRFPLKKYLRSSNIDPQHWSTFISPSMAATLEISHLERDAEMGRLIVAITHESGGVDTMESMDLHPHDTANVAPKVIFKENIVMIKHSEGRFQITFTTNASAIEFVDRIRRLSADCVAANETIPLLREGGLKAGSSIRKNDSLNRLSSMNGLASQSSGNFMPPPPTQLSQSFRHFQTGFSPPSPSQKRRRYDFDDAPTSYREMDSADNVDINVEDDKLLTESILRVVREPDFVRLVEKLRTIDALKLNESFSSKHS